MKIIIAILGMVLVMLVRRWLNRRREVKKPPLLAKLSAPFLSSNYVLLRGMMAGFYVVASAKRAGKSYMMVLGAALELAFGKKQVLLYLPGVNKQYMADLVQSLGGTRYSAFERLHFLSREEALTFWRYRGKWIAEWKLESMIQGSAKFAKINYREHDDKGCWYGLDEFAKLFPKTATSESWQELTSYLDMASKIPDVIMGTTVSFKHIVADMRPKVDVLIQCWNLSRFQRLGIRFFSGFWSVWKENPEHYSGGKGPTISWSYTPFDKLVGSAYDTAAGDTMIGGAADIGEKSRGVHIGWIAGALVLLMVVLGYSPVAGMHSAKWMMDQLTGFSGRAPQVKASLTNTTAVAVTNTYEKLTVADRTRVRSRPESVGNSQFAFSTPRTITIVSFAEVSGHKVFRLADGRVLWNPAAQWDGHNLRLRSGELCQLP